MIPKQVTERAIEGGYSPSWNIKALEDFPELYDRMVLDPTFWQALGRALDSKAHYHTMYEIDALTTGIEFFRLVLTGGDTEKFWAELLNE